MPRRAAKGIFCLEGDWWGDLNKSSTVKPVLKLLSQTPERRVPFIHRDVGTREELRYYLRKWAQHGRAGYPILYLAFHGESECILVGDLRNPKKSKVTLDELAEDLGSKLTGRIVHFSSCETLKTDKRNILRFLRKTGLVATTGFQKEVDWLKSAAFEVLMFDAMLRRRFTAHGAHLIERDLRTEAKALADEHGFRLITRDQ